MKKLKDLCLDFIAGNLNGIISRVSWGVANTHKEDLLERVVNHNRLTTDYLPHITYNLFAPSLKRLVLYRSDQITDEVLQLLSTSGCQLTELIIERCMSITDAGIVHVTKNQTELQHCKLKNQPVLTCKGLQALKSPALDILDFTGSAVDSNAVKLVLKNNATVRHLVLSRCKNIDNTLLAFIAQRLGSRLETLELRDDHCVTDAGLEQVAEHCSNLSKLNLNGCNKITNDGLHMINSKCPHLKHVDLSYCTGLLDDSSSSSVGSFPLSVQELSLCGTYYLKDSALLTKALTRLTSLRRLNLCGVAALTDEALEEILCVVGDRLEVLDLNGGLMSPLSESAVESIARHCSRVTNIGLSMNRNITGAALIPLLSNVARAEKLTHLDLSLKQLDATVLRYVSMNCRNLEELELSGVTDVTDDFLISLAEVCSGSLQSIGLKGCRQVTDTGVCALANCSRLTCAVLSGINQLTDRSILALANGCPFLEEIYLSGCSLVTRPAIKHLVLEIMRSGQVRKSLRSCRDDNKELATDTGEVSRMSGDIRKSPIVESRVRELQMFVVVDRTRAFRVCSGSIAFQTLISIETSECLQRPAACRQTSPRDSDIRTRHQLNVELTQWRYQCASSWP